ncbi:hypothetical protein TRFO_20595 [Tritrichomonas foetus]|uniref:Uncharacterized protein n=1 Tax=Tritrichomonas foetus TaxID=1144522 RepID=A0A1J4KKI6_9EUKA|nr:hypothetical protein TRFO_20595 [Tritrichomonas foetus]|eukprot:OHT10206.1 hypothetical protein TRFO_20595 [Tritrichomonas foetus]
MCYELGIGTSSNLDKALKYYQKSAAANNDFGMLSLGRFYEKYCAHNKAKKKQIFHLYEKSAKQGNHQAMYNLALCYEKKRDQENMIFWLKSASVSSPDAQFRLGVMYLKGKYVERNECSAYEYFSQASSHGHPKSQFYLGLCFEFGKGTEKNLQKSLELYRKSAEKGIPEANFKIGLMYEFELHQHVLHGHSVDNKCEKCKHSDKRIGQISDANSDASSDKNTENVKKAVYYYQRAAKIDNRYLFHVYRITNNIKKLEELLSDKKLVSLAPSIQLFIGEYYLHKNNPTCISFC